MKSVSKLLVGMATLSSLGMTAIPVLAADNSAAPFGREFKMPENRQAIEQAVENGDYNQWLSLMTANGRNPEVLTHINADNFHLLKDLEDAKKAKDLTKMKEIAGELGLDKLPRFGHGHGMMGKGGDFDSAEHEQMMDLMEAGDFQGWKTLLESAPNHPKFLDNVTEETFNLMRQLHDARQSGDMQKVKDLAQQLGASGQFPGKGFGMGFGHGHGHGKGWGKGEEGRIFGQAQDFGKNRGRGNGGNGQ